MAGGGIFDDPARARDRDSRGNQLKLTQSLKRMSFLTPLRTT
jgi:hypothetical protein